MCVLHLSRCRSAIEEWVFFTYIVYAIAAAMPDTLDVINILKLDFYIGTCNIKSLFFHSAELDPVCMRTPLLLLRLLKPLVSLVRPMMCRIRIAGLFDIYYLIENILSCNSIDAMEPTLSTVCPCSAIA